LAWIIRRHSSVERRRSAEQHHAGIVDEHVQATELRVGRAARTHPPAAPPPHRWRSPPRGAAVGDDPLGQLLDAIDTACGEGDGRAGARALQGGRLADARRGASDGDDLAREVR